MNFGFRAKRRLGPTLAIAGGVCSVLAAGLAYGAEAEDQVFAERARKAYERMRLTYQVSPNDYESAWKFGRSCFDWAELVESDETREKVANSGIAACRRAITLELTGVAGHYYLALNLGQLARTKGLGALGLVRQMEEVLQRAIEADPEFDYAGPHRALGLLYLEAPGWPVSIGSREKAARHLGRAVQLAPDYPGNHLAQLEALVRWKETDDLGPKLKRLEEVIESARSKLQGEQWEQSWSEWNRRLTAVRKAVQDLLDK